MSNPYAGRTNLEEIGATIQRSFAQGMATRKRMDEAQLLRKAITCTRSFSATTARPSWATRGRLDCVIRLKAFRRLLRALRCSDD